MVRYGKNIKMVVGMEKFILELVYNLYLTRKGSEGCRNQIGFACAGSRSCRPRLIYGGRARVVKGFDSNFFFFIHKSAN